MKRWLILVLFAVVAGGVAADMAPMRLDGSRSKEPLHHDKSPFTPLNHEKAAANPLRVGIRQRIPMGDPRYDVMTSRLDALGHKEVDARLREQYLSEFRQEFELTEKEQKTVDAYPNFFPEEHETRVRVQIFEVLRLGDKEFCPMGCQFLGKGDWDGDGSDELFVGWNREDNRLRSPLQSPQEPPLRSPLRHPLIPPAGHHAGPTSEIRVFSMSGELVWSIKRMFLFAGDFGVLDVDQDGRVELVINPDQEGNSAKEYLVLACANPGEELPVFAGDDDGPQAPSSGPHMISPAGGDERQ
jgi:hypothetical protein